uniref:Uncharacterized protein n=1 Tax=Vitis vinifera TaxID=29760 RepID=F6HEI1_VITVI
MPILTLSPERVPRFRRPMRYRPY